MNEGSRFSKIRDRLWKRPVQNQPNNEVPATQEPLEPSIENQGKKRFDWRKELSGEVDRLQFMFTIGDSPEQLYEIVENAVYKLLTDKDLHSKQEERDIATMDSNQFDTHVLQKALKASPTYAIQVDALAQREASEQAEKAVHAFSDPKWFEFRADYDYWNFGALKSGISIRKGGEGFVVWAPYEELNSKDGTPESILSRKIPVPLEDFVGGVDAFLSILQTPPEQPRMTAQEIITSNGTNTYDVWYDKLTLAFGNPSSRQEREQLGEKIRTFIRSGNYSKENVEQFIASETGDVSKFYEPMYRRVAGPLASIPFQENDSDADLRVSFNGFASVTYDPDQGKFIYLPASQYKDEKMQIGFSLFPKCRSDVSDEDLLAIRTRATSQVALIESKITTQQ